MGSAPYHGSKNQQGSRTSCERDEKKYQEGNGRGDQEGMEESGLGVRSTKTPCFHVEKTSSTSIGILQIKFQTKKGITRVSTSISHPIPSHNPSTVVSDQFPSSVVIISPSSAPTSSARQAQRNYSETRPPCHQSVPSTNPPHYQSS